METLLRGAISYLFPLLWFLIELTPLWVFGGAFLLVYRQTRPDRMAAWRLRATTWALPLGQLLVSDAAAFGRWITRRRVQLQAVPSGEDFDRKIREWLDSDGGMTNA